MIFQIILVIKVNFIPDDKAQNICNQIYTNYSDKSDKDRIESPLLCINSSKFCLTKTDPNLQRIRLKLPNNSNNYASKEIAKNTNSYMDEYDQKRNISQIERDSDSNYYNQSMNDIKLPQLGGLTLLNNNKKENNNIINDQNDNQYKNYKNEYLDTYTRRRFDKKLKNLQNSQKMDFMEKFTNQSQTQNNSLFSYIKKNKQRINHRENTNQNPYINEYEKNTGKYIKIKKRNFSRKEKSNLLNESEGVVQPIIRPKNCSLFLISLDSIYKSSIRKLKERESKINKYSITSSHPNQQSLIEIDESNKSNLNSFENSSIKNCINSPKKEQIFIPE